jgi:hypothetical protein
MLTCPVMDWLRSETNDGYWAELPVHYAILRMTFPKFLPSDNNR